MCWPPTCPPPACPACTPSCSAQARAALLPSGSGAAGGGHERAGPGSGGVGFQRHAGMLDSLAPSHPHAAPALPAAAADAEAAPAPAAPLPAGQAAEARARALGFLSQVRAGGRGGACQRTHRLRELSRWAAGALPRCRLCCAALRADVSCLTHSVRCVMCRCWAAMTWQPSTSCCSWSEGALSALVRVLLTATGRHRQ